MTEYNPYDLVSMLINGQPIHGRPIEFDTEIVNFSKLTNAFGNLVRPKRLSTICPSCGQGLEVVVSLPDPPFPVVEHNCPYCRPDAAPLSDPFNNPIESGKIDQQELDPLLHDFSKKVEMPVETVAERFATVDLAEAVTELTTELTNEVAQESISFDAPVISEADTNEDLIQVLKRDEDKGKKKKKPPKKAADTPTPAEEEPVVTEEPVEEQPVDTAPATDTGEELFDDADLAE